MPPSNSNPHAYAAQIGAVDLHLFNEGRHVKLYEKLGAHPVEVDGCAGVMFRVWAPNARRVSVIGGWNGCDMSAAPMAPPGDSGICALFAPGLRRCEQYQYTSSRTWGLCVEKAIGRVLRKPAWTGHRWV